MRLRRVAAALLLPLLEKLFEEIVERRAFLELRRTSPATLLLDGLSGRDIHDGVADGRRFVSQRVRPARKGRCCRQAECQRESQQCQDRGTGAATRPFHVETGRSETWVRTHQAISRQP